MPAAGDVTTNHGPACAGGLGNVLSGAPAGAAAEPAGGAAGRASSLGSAGVPGWTGDDEAPPLGGGAASVGSLFSQPAAPRATASDGRKQRKGRNVRRMVLGRVCSSMRVGLRASSRHY